MALSALLYAVIWAQLSLFHWAGAFRRWEMIPPVFVTPLIVTGALLGVVDRDGVLGWIALGALAAGVLEGLAGFYLHGQATLTQVSGFSLRNLMAGPPVFLPMAYTLVGAFGLAGLLWNA